MSFPIVARSFLLTVLTFALIILGLIVVVIGAILLHTHQVREQERAQIRRRYALRDTSERVALISSNDVTARGPTLRERLIADEEEARLLRSRETEMGVRVGATDFDPSTLPDGPSQGRIVRTVDGDMLLTEPPFELRSAIVPVRAGRYINRLTRRLPPWIVVCPRVRVDSLIHATNPAGRDAEDWREWRKRARLRAIDVVLCDRRTWRPVLAIVFERNRKPVAELKRLDGTTRADGGRSGDRIVEEIFYHVGLPLVIASGDFTADWRIISPYVDEAILRTRDQCVIGDHAHDEHTAVHGQARAESRAVRAEKGNHLLSDHAPLTDMEGAAQLFRMDDDDPQV